VAAAASQTTGAKGERASAAAAMASSRGSARRRTAVYDDGDEEDGWEAATAAAAVKVRNQPVPEWADGSLERRRSAAVRTSVYQQASTPTPTPTTPATPVSPPMPVAESPRPTEAARRPVSNGHDAAITLPDDESPAGTAAAMPACPICQEVFVTLAQLNQHIDDAHATADAYDATKRTLFTWLSSARSRVITPVFSLARELTGKARPSTRAGRRRRRRCPC